MVLSASSMSSGEYFVSEVAVTNGSSMCNNEGVLFAGCKIRLLEKYFSPLDLPLRVEVLNLLSVSALGKDVLCCTVEDAGEKDWKK